MRRDPERGGTLPDRRAPRRPARAGDGRARSYDLERAVAVADRADWKRAAELARERGRRGRRSSPGSGSCRPASGSAPTWGCSRSPSDRAAGARPGARRSRVHRASTGSRSRRASGQRRASSPASSFRRADFMRFKYPYARRGKGHAGARIRAPHRLGRPLGDPGRFSPGAAPGQATRTTGGQPD